MGMDLCNTHSQLRRFHVKIHHFQHSDAMCIGLIEFPGSEQQHLDYVTYAAIATLKGCGTLIRQLAGEIVGVHTRRNGMPVIA